MNWEKYLNPKRLRPSGRETENDPRNEFESDFGRIIFSPAIRRMHDKTQVFPLTTDDNIHSRLTHSMEVMAIGHSLGLRLSENQEFITKSNLKPIDVLRTIPVILKNSCLVHDIGNPPFGHFGEESIQSFFKTFFQKNQFNLELSPEEKEDFIHFDGNAQGFRVLTKLQVLDDPYGLNLTMATLASSLKYPNTGEIVKGKLNKKKRGVFQSEKEYLSIIAKDCGLLKEGEIVRHPLSFLMEAADTICYRAMDLEDGFNKGWYDYSFIESHLREVEIMQPILEELKNKKSETNKVVSLRIAIISKLVSLAINNFVSKYDAICEGTYHKELIEDDSSKLEESLSNFCINNIFPQREIQSLELTGDSVLQGLLTQYTGFIFNENKKYRNKAIGLISGSIIKAAKLENNLDVDSDFSNLSDYFYLRVIVDFISGMTDQYALSHYQKLSGQKII